MHIDPQFALAYNDRGWGKYLRGDYDGALADATESLRLTPDSASTHHTRGSAYAAKGDVANACADFSRALELKLENQEYAAQARQYIAEHCDASPGSDE